LTCLLITRFRNYLPRVKAQNSTLSVLEWYF